MKETIHEAPNSRSQTEASEFATNAQNSLNLTPTQSRHTETKAAPSLIRKSHEFCHDDSLRSWWEVLSTFPVFFLTLWGAVNTEIWMPYRIVSSVLMALSMMRFFVLFHDYAHGALLRDSQAAKVLMPIIGTLLLRTPYDWRRSHNYHHQHNCQFEHSDIGSFKLMSVREYSALSPKRQRIYRIIRNPLVIAFGYVTCFVLEAFKKLFFKDPVLKFQSAIALVAHIALGAWALSFGVDVFVLGFLMPFFITSAVGVYFFYIQHNFPTATFRNGKEWSHEYAALNSSSMLVTGPFWRWISANIGYHHIHHLNHKIPFYRLPEAMKAIPELQNPKTVDLSLACMLACLKLKLWDEEAQKMVAFPNS